ncbi:MAG: hypothetical protein AAGC55_05670, partial [Myxococcota bacterium]
SFRLGRAVSAALTMTAAMYDGRPLRPLILPGSAELMRLGRAHRMVQLVRKATLVEGPRELLGLAAVGGYGRLAHRFRR